MGLFSLLKTTAGVSRQKNPTKLGHVWSLLGVGVGLSLEQEEGALRVLLLNGLV